MPKTPHKEGPKTNVFCDNRTFTGGNAHGSIVEPRSTRYNLDPSEFASKLTADRRRPHARNQITKTNTRGFWHPAIWMPMLMLMRMRKPMQMQMPSRSMRTVEEGGRVVVEDEVEETDEAETCEA